MADFPADGLEAGREALRRFLVGEDDLTTMLTKIAIIGTETVPGCDVASITMLHKGAPSTPVFTDKVALALDETQYRIGDGPCLAAIRHCGLEHVTTSSDERWPAFNAVARQRGVLAVLSVPLGSEDVVLGGLNLYSQSVAEYDAEARETACLFADQLGLAAANATIYTEAYELSRQLQQAMESRAVIEQAKGIIMGAQHCDAEAAFDVLRRASQRENRKLRAIAAEVVDRYASGLRQAEADEPPGASN